MKFAKRRHRLNVRSNSFSIRVIDSRNSLPESVIMAPSLNCFKSRLNSHWEFHPYKFDPWCYDPGPKPRDYYQNAPTEARYPVPVFQLCELCELYAQHHELAKS